MGDLVLEGSGLGRLELWKARALEIMRARTRFKLQVEFFFSDPIFYFVQNGDCLFSKPRACSVPGDAEDYRPKRLTEVRGASKTICRDFGTLSVRSADLQHPGDTFSDPNNLSYQLQNSAPLWQNPKKSFPR